MSWHSENHWSNEITMKRYIDKVIVPFVSEKRRQLKLDSTSPVAANFDNFRGQTTDAILSLYSIQLPANCTDKLQPLDVSVNKPMKDHLKAKFQKWYAQEVKKQLETIQIKVAGCQNSNSIISGWQELEKRPGVAVNGFLKSMQLTCSQGFLSLHINFCN